jgi:glucosamine 6-phosphate synthetase-like amidotransferase/phosphosugar isomerase protein
MCSILGFVGQTKEDQWEETYRLLTALMIEGQARGTDATGYAGVTESLKQRRRYEVVSAKAAAPAARFTRSTDWRRLRHRRLRSFVGHCRYATTGSALLPSNNHPHSSKHLHLVHNGHIRNWKSLAEDRGWLLRSDCDSETILRTVEDADDPAIGLAEALRVCDGSIATLMLDAKRDGLIWIARNSASPLFLLRLQNDRRTFFASTRAILLRAFGRVLGEGWERRIDLLIPLASGCIHVATPEGGMIALGS